MAARMKPFPKIEPIIMIQRKVDFMMIVSATVFDGIIPVRLATPLCIADEVLFVAFIASTSSHVEFMLNSFKYD